MQEIKVLDNGLINKIAAGEVVERPLSVVKEMVENSIDAGATAITIEIEDGGISKIRITDNGSGIPKEQLKTAFLRHATSKISSVDDLINVLTLGFRGEALSSIAAVSQLEVTTKTANELTGSRIAIEGGRVISEGDVGCNTGTTMIIRNLFFNIPVRRKFLKKPSTEGAYISEIVEKIALGHPEIAIKYINSSGTVFQTNGNGDLKTAIYQIYGSDISKKLLPVRFEKEGFSLDGFVCKPECSKSNRSYENFYINGRYVKCEAVQNAVEDALKTRLLTGKFPVFVLKSRIKPELVDVNVHPTKMEVRFDSETDVYQWVFDAVYNAFRAENLIPDVRLSGNDPLKNVFQSIYSESKRSEKSSMVAAADESLSENKRRTHKYPDGYTDFSDKEPMSFNEALYVSDDKPGGTITDDAGVKARHISDKSIKAEADQKPLVNDTNTEIGTKRSDATSISSSEMALRDSNIKKKSGYQQNIMVSEGSPLYKGSIFRSYKIIGQLFGTYWVIEQDGDMYMIDQHAAHERIIYEEMTERYKTGEIFSQTLVHPEILKLNDKEIEVLNDNIKLFADFGFDLRQLNRNDYEVHSVPYVFSYPANSDFFTEILNWLAENKVVESSYDLRADYIAKLACKAAVKANDRLTYAEAEAIIKRIMELENPFNCPHGRPTIIKISRYEIEKMFMRVT